MIEEEIKLSEELATIDFSEEPVAMNFSRHLHLINPRQLTDIAHGFINADASCYRKILEECLIKIFDEIKARDFEIFTSIDITLFKFYYGNQSFESLRPNTTRLEIRSDSLSDIFECHDLIRCISEFNRDAYRKDIMLKIILTLYYFECFEIQKCKYCRSSIDIIYYNYSKKEIISEIKKYKHYIVKNVKVHRDQIIQDLIILSPPLYNDLLMSYVLDNIDTLINKSDKFKYILLYGRWCLKG